MKYKQSHQNTSSQQGLEPSEGRSRRINYRRVNNMTTANPNKDTGYFENRPKQASAKTYRYNKATLNHQNDINPNLNKKNLDHYDKILAGEKDKSVKAPKMSLGAKLT